MKQRPRQRLHRKTDFDRAYAAGVAYRSPHVVLICAESHGTGMRSAVVASRRVGTAVARNRAKRVLRVAQGHLLPCLNRSSLDLVLIARFGIHEMPSTEVTEEVKTLFERAGILSGHATPGR